MTGNADNTRRGWRIPDDRPVTREAFTMARPMGVEGESLQFGDVVDWLKSDDKTPYMPCTLLENMVDGLINGGRYLYGHNMGEGGDTNRGQGIPEFQVLQECNINCAVQRSQPKSQGAEVAGTVSVVKGINHLGFDEELEMPTPRTIGPFQSGRPCDIWLTVGPSWVNDMTPRQRESALVTLLDRIQPDEKGNLTKWKVTGPDITASALAIMIYGNESPDAEAAFQATKRHTQVYLPGLTPREQQLALQRLLAQQGFTGVVTANGEKLDVATGEKLTGTILGAIRNDDRSGYSNNNEDHQDEY